MVLPLLAAALLAAAPARALELPPEGSALPPQAAGRFYPAAPGALRAVVDDFVAKASTTAPFAGEIVAVLAPHAAYPFSGAVAGAAYRPLKDRSYEVVFILGAAHGAPLKGPVVPPARALTTPLGRVEVDWTTIKHLVLVDPDVTVSTSAFLGEHSIENQLPFLQRVLMPGFAVVPILLNSDDADVQEELAEALAQLARPGKTLIVVSSDLSHYPQKDKARAADQAMLGALTARPENPTYFRGASRLLVARGGKDLICTFCGEGAVASLLGALDRLRAAPRVLAYANSGEMRGGDPQHAVGYAAVAWALEEPRRPEPALDASQRRELLRLARGAASARLSGGDGIDFVIWRDPAFDRPAGTFVAWRAKDGSLRGCVGDVRARYPLAEAVERFAIASALDDKRFGPVKPEDLAGLSLEVSRLSEPRVATAESLRPGEGVLLAARGREGVFLPEVWRTLPRKEDFLGQLCEEKMSLPRDCWQDPAASLLAFDAESFSEAAAR